MNITCTINGKQAVYQVSSDMPLLDLLIDNAHITSLRPGCRKGHCGSCIVLIDDRPALSCLVPVFDIRGRDIITFERFQRTRDSTDIRKGFEQAEAVPCSYCYPSKTLITHGIISRNVNPEPDEILAAFALHACTCLEPDQVVRGVLQAGSYRGRRRKYARSK